MATTSIYNLTFEQGVRDLLKRNPVLTTSAAQLRKLYGKQNVFGMSVSITETIVARGKKLLIKTLREGGSIETDFIPQFLKLQENFTQAYAETVFTTNMNTAYNKGRFREALKHPNFIIGFEYQATLDSVVRPNHKKADGLRAPVFDPVWNFVWPPLGYNCRCSARTITRPEAEGNGWLDPGGVLVSFHPSLGNHVSVSALKSIDVEPDFPSFGKRPSVRA